ncbi:MAG: pyridoxal phosphate-dependent aminotransferase [Planctomycetes bacterium]|nr:pyridoxal phosphate-dependent aminotransferase [Planctomycetota bacterium]
MRISARVRSLTPSLTLQLIAKTKALKAQGKDVVSLGAGEPDFNTPEPVRRAAVRAMDAGHTRYTEVAGILELRKAIAALYAKPWGLVYSPSQVLVSTGAKHALFQAVQTLVDDGDPVLIPQPSWLSYIDMVLAAGGAPVPVPCTEADGLKLTPNILRAACDRAPKARLVIFNGVSNPTGVVHSPEEQAALGDVVRERDLVVLSDEIYERLVYDGARTAPFAASHPEVAARTVCVSGVSKTYAMTGWRIGWAVGPAEVLEAMTTLQGQSTSNTCSVAQYAALEALTGDDSAQRAMIAEFAKRRDHMVERLRAIPKLHLTKPEGAFYVFPRVDAYYGARPGLTGSIAMAEAILDEALVAVVPGGPFGSDAHIRLSYACSMADIDKAMDRLDAFFAKLR